MIPRCAFGARFPCGPCRKCQREADRLEAAFWRDVLFGRWNDRGYKPEEWQAKCEKIAKRDGAINTSRASHQPNRMEAEEHG